MIETCIRSLRNYEKYKDLSPVRWFSVFKMLVAKSDKVHSLEHTRYKEGTNNPKLFSDLSHYSMNIHYINKCEKCKNKTKQDLALQEMVRMFGQFGEQRAHALWLGSHNPG